MEYYNPKYKQLTMPIKEIKDVIKALTECKEAHDKENALIDELPSYDEAMKQGGESGVALMQRERETSEERKRLATEKATAIIEQSRKAYNDNIKSQVSPSGDGLEENADYKLIRDGLILTSAELETIAERNNDNIAILNAVEKYATDKDWNGFDYGFYTGKLAETFLGYGKNIFDGALHGATNPNNYQGMRILEPNEPKRLATEYGIIEAYNKATK